MFTSAVFKSGLSAARLAGKKQAQLGRERFDISSMRLCRRCYPRLDKVLSAKSHDNLVLVVHSATIEKHAQTWFFDGTTAGTRFGQWDLAHFAFTSVKVSF